MNIPSLLRMTTLGLAFSSVTFAQSPPSAPSSSPTVVTQSSRIRAFNAGPAGEVRGLYLENGSVVDITPALGGQLGAAIRKGERITVTGTKSEINGQSLMEAASIQLNGQTFSAPPSSLPPPPPRGQKVPPPCAVPADAPPPPDLRKGPIPQ